MGSFCKNHIKFQLEKYRTLSPITLKSDAKFHPTTQKFKNSTSMDYFCLKYTRFELKKCRVIFHDTEQWCKIWINPDLVVSKMAWGIGWTFIRAPKSLKIVHWWTLFVQSIYCFSWKVSEELCTMTLKGVAKFKRKLACGLKNDESNLVNFHASIWKSKNWHFDWICLSKAYKYLDKKVQKSYVSWHWRVMQSLKKNSWFQKWHEKFGEF